MRLLSRAKSLCASAILTTPLFLCSNLFSQVDTGSILGTVRDVSGGVVPRAVISLTSESTGLTLNTTTNVDGNYQFPGLRIGDYTVSAEATGFGKVTHEHLSLSIQQRLVADFTLNPGTVAETVEVTAAAAQLQTQEASVGAVVQQKLINDLPLNGRNYTFLAQLNAGVTMGQQDTRGFRDSGTFSANGLYSDQNNYLLDGIDNNSSLSDFLNGSSYAYRPSVDALQEFKVQTSNFSAELGRAAGAVLNATLKSGTNQFHGSAYEFLRNSALDAANFFENSNRQGKGAFRRNQFGATLGGPLALPGLKRGGENKTFFFMDYEGTRVRQATPYISTVPTALERSSGYTNLTELIADQSGSRTDILNRTFPLGTVFDPATTRAVTAGQADPVTGKLLTKSGFVREPFQGNVLPVTRIDPNAVKLLNLFPAPNRPGLFNNYTSNPTYQDQVDQGDVRIDRLVSAKDIVFGRFSYSTDGSVIPPPFPGVANGGAFNTGIQKVWSHMEALSWTHIVSPTLVNEARAGYTYLYTERFPPFGDQLDAAAQLGIQGAPQAPNYGGLPTFSIGGLSALGVASWIPTWEDAYTFQLTDNVSKLAGNHSLKAGFEFKKLNTLFWQPRTAQGTFSYSGTFTEVPNTSGGNTGLAQLLLNPAASSVAGGANFVGGPQEVQASNRPDPVPEVTWYTYAGYVDDTWKVNKKLTVNLGLRYDFTRHGIVPGGYSSNFLYYPTPHIEMSKDQCRKGLSASYLELTAKDGIAITCAVGNGLVEGKHLQFSPRVGIAYQITPKFILRTGFGFFYGISQPASTLRSISQNYPFSYDVDFTNNDPASPIVYANGTRATLESGLAPINPQDSTNFNARNLVFGGIPNPYALPYTMMYNFSLQRQLTASQSVTLAYVGNQTRKLENTVGYNSVRQILPPGLNQRNYIQFPDFALNSMGERLNWGSSYYHSMQGSFERRFSQGFSALANYTWSKCRTDARQRLVSVIGGGANGGYRGQLLPGFGVRGDYSLCDVDVTQLAHISGTYELPVGRGKQFLNNLPTAVNSVVGGWRVNSIATLQSGTPFTIGCPSPTTTGSGCFALLVPGKDRYAGLHNVDQWMNPAAFAQPPVATTVGQTDYSPLGGAPTQLRSPGFHRLDLSMFKEFPIRERMRLEFRAESFNLTNTPQFGIPGFTGPGLLPTPGVTDFTNTKNFGRITSLRDGANDQRQIQFALKLYW